MFSAFSQFAVSDTLEFFNRRGMATKVEAEDRVFPVSNKAQAVWDVLTRYIKENGVEIWAGNAVANVVIEAVSKMPMLTLKDGATIHAKSCVVATGGTSRPETGSSGEGFLWLKKMGHTIFENNVALVPIALSDKWAKQLGGVTLTDIKLTVFQNKKKQDSSKGKLLFTHFGISGPTVLNMSTMIGELLQYGDVTIMLDLFPALDHLELKQQLQTLLIDESNKKIKNTISRLVPASLSSALLALCDIDGETSNHSVSAEARRKLVSHMKEIPLHVAGLLGADKAVVSSGGVALSEVNFKTMESRMTPNIYLVGDVLNIDRPSGGYSLQLCWTTGYVAGNSC